MQPFRTANLNEAAYLRACGLPIVDTYRDGPLVGFVFPAQAGEAITGFYNNAPAPAQRLLESLKAVRALVSTTKSNPRKEQKSANGYPTTATTR